MNIGQFSDSFLPVVDGVGRVVESYADTLGHMGHGVRVFAPWADMGDLTGRPFQVETYATTNVPRFQYRVGVPALDYHFEKALRTAPLDIVHVHSPFMLGRSGLRCATKRGLPIVGTFHSKYYDDFLQIFKVDRIARYGAQKVSEFYDLCDEVWAVTEASGETLREYGYRGRLRVMPNGTTLRALDPTVLPEIEARYGIDRDTPLILFVGQMNWKKNIRRSLEAAAALKAQGVSFTFLLAGLGPHDAEIRDAIATMGIADCTRAIGHIGDTRTLDGLYYMASLLLFPSLYDNGPMVVREAAAMGTPSVLVAGTSAAECIEDGKNGLTSQDTAEALSDAIRRALEDREWLARMGACAQETIPMPWHTLMKQVEARYRTLIEEKTFKAALL